MLLSFWISLRVHALTILRGVGGGGDDNSNFLISENNINLQIAGMLPRKSWVAFFVSQAGVGEISWQPALRDILEIDENKF